MDEKSESSGGTITSLDGTRTITVEEFDQLFDDGSDEIDAFIDWSKARMVGSALEVRVGRDETIEKSDNRHSKAPKSAAE